MAHQVIHMRLEEIGGDEARMGLRIQETQRVTFPSHWEAEKMERWPSLRFSRTFFHPALSEEK